MANLSLMAFSSLLLDIPFLGTYIILAMVGIPAIVFLLFVMTPKGKQWFNSCLLYTSPSPRDTR